MTEFVSFLNFLKNYPSFVIQKCITKCVCVYILVLSVCSYTQSFECVCIQIVITKVSYVYVLRYVNAFKCVCVCMCVWSVGWAATRLHYCYSYRPHQDAAMMMATIPAVVGGNDIVGRQSKGFSWLSTLVCQRLYQNFPLFLSFSSLFDSIHFFVFCL